MAAANQRNRSGNHRGKSRAQQASGLQDKAHDLAEQAGNKLGVMREQMADYVTQGNEQFGQMTRGHEGQAVFVALAAGFGIGLVVGMSLAAGSRRPTSWRDRLRHESEHYGKQFMHHVDSMLPEMIGKHLHKS